MTWGHAPGRAAESGAAPDSPAADLPKSIGQYRIIGKLGEGGMGIVFEAEQQNPKRRVALKVVRGGQFVDESQVKMFQREAETLGRLKHANIGAIYESGRTDGGQHFFAMELVHGETLDIHLRRFKGKITPAELIRRLELFRKIADAVHYAHQRGVIHRDLKPSNIIVTKATQGDESSRSGIPEVKILDFGLARITEGDVAAATMITEVGLIKGTLPYMSPEQARGLPEEIDLRTDVYALGVILYEMVAGQRPYDTGKSSLVEAVRVIQEEPPTPLRPNWKGTRKLDEDVATITGKALEKESDQRYGSAAALSDDVGRYLTSQPILARPPSTAYQLKKLVARNKLGAAFAVTVLLLLVGFGSWMSVLYFRALRAESAALAERDKSEASKLLAMARLEEDRYPTAALALATQSLEIADTPEARGLAQKILWGGPPRQRLELEKAPISQTGIPLDRIAASPDGRWLAAHVVNNYGGGLMLVSRDGSVQKLIHQDVVQGMYRPIFSPESNLLITHELEETAVRIWSVPSGDLIREIEVSQYSMVLLRGEHLLIFSPAEAGEEAFQVLIRSWPLEGGPPKTLGEWTTTLKGKLLRRFYQKGAVWDVDPTGRKLAFISGQRILTLPLDSLDSSSPSILVDHSEEVRSFLFAPSGDRLFLEDESGRFLVLSVKGDAELVQPERILENPGLDWMFQPRFDPTGSWLVWGSRAEKSAILWDLEGPPNAQPIRLPADEANMSDGTFGPGGEWLATIDGRHISFWPLEEPWHRAMPASGTLYGGDFSPTPNGRFVAHGRSTGILFQRLDPRDREAEAPNVEGRWTTLDFHPTLPEMLVGSYMGGVSLKSLAEGTTRELLGIAANITATMGGVALDPSFHRAAMSTFTADGPEGLVLRIWDLDSGEQRVWPLKDSTAGPDAAGLDHGVYNLRFGMNGEIFSAGGGGIERWDTETGESTHLIHSNTARIEMSPDRESLLAIAGDKYVDYYELGQTRLFLVNLEDGSQREITTHGSNLLSVDFDSTGEFILTGDTKGVLRIGPVTGEEPHLLLGHREAVAAIAVTPDNRWVFSAGSGVELLHWPMPDLSQPPLHTLPVEEFLEHLYSLTNLRAVEAPDIPEGWKLEFGPR